MKRLVYLCSKDQVSSDTLLGVEVEGTYIAVYQVDGEYHAISGFCPHKRADLARRGRLSGCVITCTRHNWQYNAITYQGIQPPTAAPLPSLSLVEQGEKLYVQFER